MANDQETLDLLAEVMSVPAKIISGRHRDGIETLPGVEPRLFWMARKNGGSPWQIMFEGRSLTVKEANTAVAKRFAIGLLKQQSGHFYYVPGHDAEYWPAQTRDFFRFAKAQA